MGFDLRILLTIAPLIYACAVGIIYFKRLPIFGRLLFAQLICSFLAEVVNSVTISMSVHNIAFLNSYMVVDFWLVCLALYYLDADRKYRNAIRMLLCLQSVLWVTEFVFQHNLDNMHSYTFSSACIIITTLSLWVCIRKMRNHREPIQTSPWLWFCLSNFIFYGCNAPLFSLFNLLATKYVSLSVAFWITPITGAICNILCAHALRLSARPVSPDSDKLLIRG